MPERIVTVHAFRELWRREGAAGEPPRAAYEIECSSGTYVRSLIADLHDGYCLELRRTAIGDFDVQDACAPPPRGSAWEDPPADRAGRGARASRRGLPPIGFAADVKVTPLPEVEHGRSRSIAVGTFDGVHLGHREVIRGADSVLTFDPHPVSVVAPQHTPRLLTDPERKAELVASLGVQEMIVIPFDAEFAARPAEDFIEDVLVGALGARQVSVGENFRFGRRAQGDPELLRADGRFETVVHPLLEIDGEVVSSSHIRGLLLAGELTPGQQDAGQHLPAAGDGAARR